MINGQTVKTGFRLIHFIIELIIQLMYIGYLAYKCFTKSIYAIPDLVLFSICCLFLVYYIVLYARSTKKIVKTEKIIAKIIFKYIKKIIRLVVIVLAIVEIKKQGVEIPWFDILLLVWIIVCFVVSEILDFIKFLMRRVAKIAKENAKAGIENIKEKGHEVKEKVVANPYVAKAIEKRKARQELSETEDSEIF